MNAQIALMDADASVIYGLDAAARIVFCNAAWDRFAAENNGESLLRPSPVGRFLSDYIPSPILGYYAKAHDRVRETGQPWDHFYECSSTETMRQFHMRVSPT